MNFSKSVTMDVGFYDGQEIPIEAVEEYEAAVKLMADLHNFIEVGFPGHQGLLIMKAVRDFLEQAHVKLFTEPDRSSKIEKLNREIFNLGMQQKQIIFDLEKKEREYAEGQTQTQTEEAEGLGLQITLAS